MPYVVGAMSKSSGQEKHSRIKQLSKSKSEVTISHSPLSINKSHCQKILSLERALGPVSMAIHKLPLLLLISIIILFHNRPVLGDIDEEDTLFTGINSYRTSQNLTILTKNENADCLADEIADQFKNKPCTNDTGSATVPGTEPQFANYPKILAKCHLNVSDTRDGSIMPVCVPRLDPNLVLTNFTKTQYSLSLNDSKFTGMGVGKEDDWIVVVLTTNTPEGSYSTATKDDDDSNGLTISIGLVNYLTIFMFSFCFFLY